MTNNREKYKRAFSVLHASQETDWEAIMKTSREHNMRKAGTKLILAAALVSLLAITASAAGMRLMQGWGGNMEVLSREEGMEVHVHTDNLTEPVEIREGRMWFVVNGENRDITDEISQTEAFTYTFMDEQGITHYWVLGLNGEELENYGYAEYLKTDTWQAGYSARVNSNPDGTTDAVWLERWKEENNCPW